MVWPSIIAGAASIGSSLLGRSSGPSVNKNMLAEQYQQFANQGDRDDYMWPYQVQAFHNAEARAAEAHQWNQWAFHERNTGIQRTAADARAAGLHPLFALGGSVNSSPTFGVDGGHITDGGMSVAGGGQADTGSHVGDVLKGIQDGLAMWQARKGETRADALAAAAIRRDNAHADLLASQAKREQQRSNVVQTIPLPDRPLIPTVKDFPRRIEPQAVHRDRVVVVSEDGRQYEVPNPEVFEEFFSPSTLGAVKEYIGRAIREVQSWGGLPHPKSRRW